MNSGNNLIKMNVENKDFEIKVFTIFVKIRCYIIVFVSVDGSGVNSLISKYAVTAIIFLFNNW